MEELVSPMAANVWKVECAAGDVVNTTDPVIILEAMKMEVEVFAPVDGTVTDIKVKSGDAVEEDQVLLVIESA